MFEFLLYSLVWSDPLVTELPRLGPDATWLSSAMMTRCEKHLAYLATLRPVDPYRVDQWMAETRDLWAQWSWLDKATDTSLLREARRDHLRTFLQSTGGRLPRTWDAGATPRPLFEPPEPPPAPVVNAAGAILP